MEEKRSGTIDGINKVKSVLEEASRK